MAGYLHSTKSGCISPCRPLHRPLFLVRSSMRIFHLLSAQHALDNIAKSRLKISRLDELNDPFELCAAELSNPKHRLAFRQFKETMAKRYGLLCFSKSWMSPLLWSHYGDRHRGVALELEVADDLVTEVSYQPTRIDLDIKRKLSTGGLREADVNSILRTKFNHWEYEQEVRVFLRLDDPPDANGLHFYNLGSEINLKGIILGPLCKISVANIERVLPKGQSLQLRKARLAFNTFSVVGNRAFKKRPVNGTA